jgi:hypothetical protein
VPRIEDIAEVKDFLDKQVPEAKVGMAHGQMAAGQLEDVMTAFYEGKYDILLSTTIVESGLDIPERQHADRPPRRHVRPRAALSAAGPCRPLQGARLCALHLPANRKLTEQAERRLKVLQSLENAGRRLPARQPRSRHPRRRQSARRRAVRPYQGSRLRALPADAGGGGRGAEVGVEFEPTRNGRRRSRSARR